MMLWIGLGLVVVAVVAFVAMEGVSYVAHRWVMHGPGMGWHGSHHAPATGRFERNDLFPLTFPVIGTVHYTDSFGDCRDGCTRRHEGIDIMGTKLLHEVAAAAGRVTFVRADGRWQIMAKVFHYDLMS